MKQFLIVLFALLMFAFAKLCCEKTPAATADIRQNSTTSSSAHSHNKAGSEDKYYGAFSRHELRRRN